MLEHRSRRLTQSGVILDYLATTLGRFGWQSDDERREILRWLLWDNHKLTSYIATLRYLSQSAKSGVGTDHVCQTWSVPSASS